MFKKQKNKKNIIFTDTYNIEIDGYDPKPAYKNVPEWYKNTKSYHSYPPHKGLKEKLNVEQTAATIKKCMPVYDSMTAGYYIVTNSDISVIDKDGETYYIWGVGPGIDFHALSQLELYPNAKKYGPSFPKFLNKWSIETPPGYSCLFVNPMHNSSEIFSIIEGIVDTDKYVNNIHFPFTLNDPNWRGIIPAGTPIVQVIPFKRDNWEMSIGNNKDLLKQKKVSNKIKAVFFEGYKNFYRSEKEFK